MRTAKLPLILLFMLAGVAAAQDAPAAQEKKPAAKKPATDPAGPEFDEGARKIWDTWKRMHYNLAKAGVKRVTHGIEATVAMMGGAPMQATAVFKWDGKKGSLDWEGNRQVGAMLAQQGWSVADLAVHYKKNGIEENLAGCKITLKAGETEDRLEVTGGKAGAPIKAFVFGKDGVLKGMVIEIPNPATGQPVSVDFDMGFTKLENGKYFNTGWEFGMGAFTDKTTLTVEKRGGFYVVTKADSSGTAGGQPIMTYTLRFTDWKFNDDVDKAEKKEQPAAGTESKPDGK